MAYYFDTSPFLTLVVKEEHSAAMRAWATNAHPLVSSDLLRTESLRAARKHSLAALSQTRLLLDSLILLTVSTDICERAAQLDPQIVRSLDAIHLASALALGDELHGVVTYDDRFATACTFHGIPTLKPQ